MKLRRIGKVSGLFVLSASLMMLGFITASTVLHQFVQQKIAEPSDRQSATQVVSDNTLQLTAMGDMLAHDSIVAQAKTADGYDFTPYFTQIHTLYDGSDLVFCNPETPVAGDTLGVSGYPSFNAPSAFARDLRKTGCNTINLATNHIFDKGQEGIDTTRSVWEAQKPLLLSGANRNHDEQSSVSYTTVNGIRCAFVAFADFSNIEGFAPHSINIYHDTDLVTRLLSEARVKADVVIVSAHWGNEDSNQVNDDQKQAATLFTTLGADIVIGTGPHVLQTVQWMNRPDGHKTLVWYSIGNMLSSQLAVDELTGVIADMTIRKTDNGISVEKVQARPTYMSYDWSQADRAAERLSTRTHFMLQPLASAGDRVSNMFENETVATRMTYVKATLGSDVSVVDTELR